MYFKRVLIYVFLFTVFVKLKLCETASMLKFGIWGKLNLCSWTVVTQNAPEKKLSLVPCKSIATVFALTEPCVGTTQQRRLVHLTPIRGEESDKKSP